MRKINRFWKFFFQFSPFFVFVSNVFLELMLSIVPDENFFFRLNNFLLSTSFVLFADMKVFGTFLSLLFRSWKLWGKIVFGCLYFFVYLCLKLGTTKNHRKGRLIYHIPFFSAVNGKTLHKETSLKIPINFFYVLVKWWKNGKKNVVFLFLCRNLKFFRELLGARYLFANYHWSNRCGL